MNIRWGIIPARAGFTSPGLVHVGDGVGIIPARAGFTLCVEVGWLPQKDHPRSRGVYSSGMPDDRSGMGSSPLARGLRDPGPFGAAVDRIIPARAGFTLPH